MKQLLHVVIRRARYVAATPILIARSVAATRHAARAGAPGIQFARFGRILGLKPWLSATDQHSNYS